MADGTKADGTSVGNVYLDLVVRDTIVQQVQDLASKAQAAARRQFSDIGKAVGDAMTQGMADASRAMTNTVQQSAADSQKAMTGMVNGVFSKSVALMQAKLNSLQKTLDANEVRLEQIVQDTARGFAGSPWADQATESALNADKTYQALQRQQEKLENQMAYLREKLAIEVQAQAQKQAAAEQAAYAKAAKAAEDAAKRQLAAARQAHTATAPPAASRKINTANAVRSPQVADQQEKAADSAEKCADRQAAAKKELCKAQSQPCPQTKSNNKQCPILKSSKALTTLGNKSKRVFGDICGNASKLSKQMKPFNAQLTRASSWVQSLGARLKGIVAGALVFNLLSAGLRQLVGWLGNALQSSNSFRQALANLQGAASMAAAPLVSVLGNALSYVINMLATGVAYLAQFISMLTGKSLSAMKNSAKAMNGYGSAAGNAAKQTKKANGELAAFDELNVLNKQQEDDSGASGGGGGAIAPNYDFVDQTGAGFASLMDRVKSFWDAFTDVLAPSIAAWSAAWEQIKAAAVSVWPQIQTAALGLWDNALQPLLGYLAGTFAPGVINAFSQAFAPIVADEISAYIQIAANSFEWFCGIVTDAINNLLRPALDLLLTVWQGMMDGITNAWATYGQPLMEGLILAFQNLQSIFSTLYYTVVEPILANIIALLDQFWSQHAMPLWNNLLLLIASVQNMLLTFWNNVLAPLVNWLIATFGPTFADVFNAVAGYVTTAMGVVADVIDVAVILLRGLADFLTAVFKGDWDAAWSAIGDTVTQVWDRIQETVKSAVNGVIGFVNGMIQAIVDGINRVVDALNGLSFTVPDWVPGVGGSQIGFSMDHVTAPQIPMLASGGVIDSPTLAMMGEYAGAGQNPEIVAPQSLLAETVSSSIAPLAAALEELIQYLRDGGNQEIVIRFAASGGLEQLVRLLKPYIDKENNRRGSKIITGGVY